jgi:DNA-binding transcriptional ArsR family regulator
MKPLFHPAVEDVTVEGILYALADPVRVDIYSRIVGAGCPQTCSNFLQVVDKNIPKSTLSQHFKALRESGLIHSERIGVEMRSTSRCAELEQRFPGLIRAIVDAHQVQLQGNARAMKVRKRRVGGERSKTNGKRKRA